MTRRSNTACLTLMLVCGHCLASGAQPPDAAGAAAAGTSNAAGSLPQRSAGALAQRRRPSAGRRQASPAPSRDSADPPPALSARLPPPKQVDLRRAAAAGIRYVDGKHLRLFTDLPSSPAVDQLPRLFDAAAPLWAEYFGIPPEQLDDWRVQGFLVDQRERYAALDLLPRDNPIFTNGYAHAQEFWLVEQPSDYYRRHLLLHEGTHSFMYTFLGAGGPGWYMEGVAELLGTHRWNNDRLQIGIVPASSGDAPMWGRIKLIRDALAEGRALPAEAILHFDNRRSLDEEQYAWAWALANFLDDHPKYRARFRSLQREAANPRFNDRFRELFAADSADQRAEWQAYLAALDYGYDVAAMAMTHRPATPVGERRRSVQIVARGGWQSTGLLLSAGQAYEVTAAGRFRVADDGQPWISEPGGVTIEYHEGRPLGMLLGALRPTSRDGATVPTATARPRRDSGDPARDARADPDFLHPLAIGRQATITPTRDAVLYARVNDSPAKLDDNAGEVVVRVRSADGQGE